MNKNGIFEEFQQNFSEELSSVMSDIAKEIHETLQSLMMSTMQNTEKLETSLSYHIQNMNKSFPDLLSSETNRNRQNDMVSKFDLEDSDRYMYETYEKRSIKSDPRQNLKLDVNEDFQENLEREMIRKRREFIKKELRPNSNNKPIFNL